MPYIRSFTGVYLRIWYKSSLSPYCQLRGRLWHAFANYWTSRRPNMEITRPHTEVSKWGARPGKLISNIISFQDIWRRLHFSARKIYRESFSLVKLELLSTRARIHIKLPRSQITRPSPKNRTQVLVLHAFPNVWSGQPRNHLKPWMCEARISKRLIHTSLLILRMCLIFWSSDYVLRDRSSSLLRVIAGSQQFEWHLPYEDTPEMHDMSFPCRHKWTSLKKHSNVGHHKKGEGTTWVGNCNKVCWHASSPRCIVHLRRILFLISLSFSFTCSVDIIFKSSHKSD